MTETIQADRQLLAERVKESPTDIIRLAIERGVSPKEMSELYTFARQVEEDRQRKAFAVAMMQAQSSMPVVVKDKKNESTNGSRFASLEHVSKAITPIYRQHGFTLSFSEDPVAREGYVRVICDVRHIEGHCERKYGDFPLDNVGMKGSPTKTGLHGTGSSMSYGMRRLKLSIFDVTVADEDRDGTGGLIQPEQIGQINDLLGLCRELGKPVDLDKFCNFVREGCRSIAEFNQADYRRAVTSLTTKARSAKAGAR